MRTFIRSIGVIGMSVILATQFSFVAEAKSGDVTTWLGVPYRGDGADGNTAYLDNPFGFAADDECNLYIADTNDNVIRRVDNDTNVISTHAGNGGYGLINGVASKANFRAPYDNELGPDGEVYVVDTDNKAIRVVKNGSVTTWLSNIKSPTGSYLDGTTLYIAETGNNRILKATIPNGTVSTVATLATPGKMAMLDGYMYVINAGKTSLTRVDVTTGAVVALKTDLADAEGVAVYNDEVYFTAGADGLYNEIWKYTPSTDEFVRLINKLEDTTYNHASDILFCGGSMYLLFSGGSSAYRADLDGSNPVKLAGVDRYGNSDGTRSQLMLGRPKAMVMSKDRKHIYILENHVIKDFNLTTKTLTFLVGFARDNYRDAAGADARMSGPTQMVLSPDGKKIYFADRNNNRIRQLTISTATLSTITGAGVINTLGERNGYKEGADCHDEYDTGVAGCAYFDRPRGIAVSPDGKTLYVADTTNNRIRTVNISTGVTKLLAGSSTAGLKDGVGSSARFKSPISMVLSRDGKNLYIVEQGSHSLRKLEIRTKRVTTLVGNGKAGYRDGAFKDARMSYPDSIALGPGNTLFISEVGVQNIRKVNLDTKIMSTLSGNGSRGLVNGKASVARFNNPRGMMMLNSGYLLVADQSNDVIRAVRL